MSAIVEKSVKKPLLVLVVFTVLTLGGFVCYNMLKLDLLPEIEFPVITVSTVYPGAGASEVETSVTKKVEDALSTMENLNTVNSVSREGVSIVSIEFNEGTDVDKAVQDAQRKINAIMSDLPKEILDPSINKFSMDEQPIMKVATSSSLSATEFYNLVEDRIQPRLAKLEGVGAVDITGGYKREIKVNIDSEKLRAYNLSILQVVQAIQMANMEVPAGNIENLEATYSVRLVAKYSSLEDIRNTVILNTPDGGDIKIKDIAEIEDGIAEQKLINRINASDAIGLSIQKQSDANAVSVADEIKTELATIEQEYAQANVKFDVAIDTSIYTKASAHAVVVDLFLAILIVAIVCFVFLHNLRSAMIIIVAVPLSIVPAFIALYVLDCSLNMMSLMALSLVVGILVDDSIVVIENMFHHMELGKSRWQAALDGCKQIMFTVMAITLVIVVVFLPLSIIGGLIGNILKEFAIPIIAATLSSLLVSFTVTPLLMSRFGKLSDNNRPTLSGKFSRFVENGFNSLKNWYAKVLSWGLKHKVVVVAVTVFLLVNSFALISNGLIGMAFVPETDQGEFTVTLDMDPQVTLYQNNLLTMQVEKIIQSKPEVSMVYTNVGSSGMVLGNSSQNNMTTISVKLKDKEDRDISTEDFSQQVKEEIMQIPGVRARVSVASTGGGNEPIQLVVQGADFEKVYEGAGVLLDIVRSIPGTTDAKFSIDDPTQEVHVRLDREKMAKMGLSSSDVGSALRVAFAGNDDSKYTDNNFEYDINIKLDNFDRTNAENVSRITFINNSRELIELSQIADISYEQGPSTLERTDRISSITVKSNVVGRPSGTVGAEIMSAIEGKMPAGTSIKTAGTMDQQNKAFTSLIFAFIAAIVMIYLIMVALYDSLLDPIVVLVSIPLSLIGAFLALALTMNSLTIFSIIGLIVLIGLVAKNAILLVDFTNHIRSEQNMDVFEALIEAGKERLRPILMTTFAMIFGMLPIALASGDGAEMKNGMAWAIIGGLTSSMILTLIVVPVVYYIFNKMVTQSMLLKSNLKIKYFKKWLEGEDAQNNIS